MLWQRADILVCRTLRTRASAISKSLRSATRSWRSSSPSATGQVASVLTLVVMAPSVPSRLVLPCRSPSAQSAGRTGRNYRMNGGGLGMSRRNLALLHLPDGKKRWVNVGGKGVVKLLAGEQLYRHTPRGVAWGERVEGDLVNGTVENKSHCWKRNYGLFQRSSIPNSYGT